MAEHIEREAVLAICQMISACEWNHRAAPVSWADAYNQFAEDVEGIPAADVVEVVRCGQCLHWDKAGYCHHPAGMSYCGERAAKVGFCYFGERREGDTDA